MTRDTENCRLSVINGVRIRWVNFGKNIRTFCKDKRKCRYIRVSVEWAFTVFIYLVNYFVFFLFCFVFLTLQDNMPTEQCASLPNITNASWKG